MPTVHSDRIFQTAQISQLFQQLPGATGASKIAPKITSVLKTEKNQSHGCHTKSNAYHN